MFGLHADFTNESPFLLSVLAQGNASSDIVFFSDRSSLCFLGVYFSCVPFLPRNHLLCLSNDCSSAYICICFSFISSYVELFFKSER